MSRHQLLGVAALAAHAQKTVLETAALQIRLELLSDVRRQWAAALFTQRHEPSNESALCWAVPS